MKEQDYIRLDQIVKVYPPNKIALNKVTLDIHKGEIHSIIGENGAGKSTLMKVLYGLEKADEGTIWLRGQKVTLPPLRRPSGRASAWCTRSLC